MSGNTSPSSTQDTDVLLAPMSTTQPWAIEAPKAVTMDSYAKRWCSVEAVVDEQENPAHSPVEQTLV